MTEFDYEYIARKEENILKGSESALVSLGSYLNLIPYPVGKPTKAEKSAVCEWLARWRYPKRRFRVGIIPELDS